VARRSPLRRSTLRRTPIVPQPFVPASPAQRDKVARRRCAVCERRPCDPAHLVPQRLGGCAHRDCVIALCRTHHRLYDAGELRLAPYLRRGFAAERRHALTHTSQRALRRALAGRGWPKSPRWATAAARPATSNRPRRSR
jgi:hypothetical protein